MYDATSGVATVTAPIARNRLKVTRWAQTAEYRFRITTAVLLVVAFVALTICASAQDQPAPIPVFRNWIHLNYGPPEGRRDATYQSWVKHHSQIPRLVTWADAHFPAPTSGQNLDVYIGRCATHRDEATFGYGSNTVRICNDFVYESVDKYISMDNMKTSDADHVTEGLMYFVFLHEFAHAIESNYGLPVLGNRESSADEFATLVVVGHPSMYSDAAAFVQLMWDEQRLHPVAGAAFEWDRHPGGNGRASDIACFLYESDASTYRYLAQRYGLTGDAEASCRGDYLAALWSWRMELQSSAVRISADPTKLFD